MENDLKLVSRKIDEEKEYLEYISNEIWSKPELQFQEVHAHTILTEALEKYGFLVQKHYFLETAFRAEFSNKNGVGPTIAILCEYDALPGIGHGCGHNLIAESGIAAGMAVKAAMESDSSIYGKIIVLGTPAEEGGGGKIKLIEHGAFENIDAAIIAHPAKANSLSGIYLCRIKLHITFKGKESHASAYPWEGRNALDAAVACYQNIAYLKQHIRPVCKIHGIITKGGDAPNVIPGETKMEFNVRALTVSELEDLCARVKSCILAAAEATGCEATYRYHNKYENVIHNKVLMSLYREYTEQMGTEFTINPDWLLGSAGSTDMGNVSHVVPGIHPLYSIGGTSINHTKEFTDEAVSPKAEEAAKTVAKVLAMMAIRLMRSPDLVQDMKDSFQKDIQEELSGTNQ